MILGSGAGITLIGVIIAVAGVVAIVAGSAVAAKASVEYGLRKRIEHQLREKKLPELVDLSRQLGN